jgi:hypothetical protein
MIAALFYLIQNDLSLEHAYKKIHGRSVPFANSEAYRRLNVYEKMIIKRYNAHIDKETRSFGNDSTMTLSGCIIS